MRNIEESVDSLRRTADAMSQGLAWITEAERMAGFGFFIWDVETDDLWVSEGAYAVFGRRRLSALTSSALNEEVLHPDDAEEVMAGLAAAVGGGQHDLIHRVVRPDGEVRPFTPGRNWPKRPMANRQSCWEQSST